MENRIDLHGQRILVAGAGGAIGSATARACAALGADLELIDLKAPSTLAEELRAKVSARAHALDNSDSVAVNALIGSLPPLDALADCSGYYANGYWRAGGESWE